MPIKRIHIQWLDVRNDLFVNHSLIGLDRINIGAEALHTILRKTLIMSTHATSGTPFIIIRTVRRQPGEEYDGDLHAPLMTSEYSCCSVRVDAELSGYCANVILYIIILHYCVQIIERLILMHTKVSIVCIRASEFIVWTFDRAPKHAYLNY